MKRKEGIEDGKEEKTRVRKERKGEKGVYEGEDK